MNVPATLIDPADQGDGDNAEATAVDDKGTSTDESQGSENGAQPSDAGNGEVPADKGTDTDPELYELPDGRKVDFDTALKAWKDDFLPDYTQKSQRLAALEKGDVKELTQTNDAQKGKHAWEDPNWVPGSYQELIQAASEASRLAAQAERDAADRSQAEIKSLIDTQIAEIRKTDKNLDEEALFKHANKYQFTDLRLAHANMAELRNAAKEAGAETAKNIKGRAEAAPVSGGSAPAGSDTGVDYSRISSARSISDAVQDHYDRLKRK